MNILSKVSDCSKDTYDKKRRKSIALLPEILDKQNASFISIGASSIVETFGCLTTDGKIELGANIGEIVC